MNDSDRKERVVVSMVEEEEEEANTGNLTRCQEDSEEQMIMN